MKKNFENPEINVNTVSVEDVVTASSYTQGGFEGWAPDSDDSEFGN